MIRICEGGSIEDRLTVEVRDGREDEMRMKKKN